MFSFQDSRGFLTRWVSGFIILLIPPGKVSKSFADPDGGAEAVVFFETGAVGIGDRDVAGLHADQFAVSVKVVVPGEDAGADKLLLESGDIVQEVLGSAAADVIDGVGRQGEPVFSGEFFGGALHHADNAFDDVIHVGEVALAVAVIEDLDGLARGELVRRGEIEHVRAAGGAVYGEETQAGGRDVIQLGIAVGQELIAFFCGGIEGDRIVNLVVCTEGNLFVTAVDRGGRGIDQVFHGVVAAGFQDVVEADEVRFHVDVGMIDAVADAGLGGQIDHDGRFVLCKNPVQKFFVRDGAADENVADGRVFGSFFDQAQAVFF